MSPVTTPIAPTDPTADWRLYQFLNLGYSGDLAEFLAASRMDVGHVKAWISKGASPIDAARLEAGFDFAGDDHLFDHKMFDKLLKTPTKRTVKRKKKADPPEG